MNNLRATLPWGASVPTRTSDPLRGVDCEIPHRPNGEGVMCLIWHTSHPLNFGVPTNPKPVSSQEASHYEDARCAI
ncbi:hypothetical protein L3X38_022853 [Prunus dulcis]|uniref:Uncharacterized protein n=1 Tax=Prunus dulcis TaxID=3755 RepID=A0AAD4Z4Z7_PRUDU|nr:hypothetical protein L3X38_022853 [Prunus dulcis]